MEDVSPVRVVGIGPGVVEVLDEVCGGGREVVGKIGRRTGVGREGKVKNLRGGVGRDGSESDGWGGRADSG